MVRPGTDQERKSERVLTILLCSQASHAGPLRGKHPVGHEAEGGSRIVGTCCYCGFQEKEWARQGN